MGKRFSSQDALLSAAAVLHFQIRRRRFIINLAAGRIHSFDPSVFLA